MNHYRNRHARWWNGLLFLGLISAAAPPGCSRRSHHESAPPAVSDPSAPLAPGASALTAPAGSFGAADAALIAAPAAADPAAAPPPAAPAASGPARIDVTSVGAVGDGVDDDTAAIQRAFAGLPPGGGTVFFPGGTYLVLQSQLIISRSQVRLEGAPGARIRGKPGAWESAKLLRVQGTPEKHLTDITITGLEFD